VSSIDLSLIKDAVERISAKVTAAIRFMDSLLPKLSHPLRWPGLSLMQRR
jgi:L-rhamnose isomerase